MNTTIVNGKSIEHGDVIHTVINTEYSFIERIKILLFGKTLTWVKVYVRQELVNTIASEAKVNVLTPSSPLASKRNRKGLLFNNDTNNCNEQ